MLAVERAPRDRGVDAEDRIDRRDRPVGAERELRAGVEQAAEGVGGPDALGPNPLFHPASVVDHMVRLHRGDHPTLAERRDVLGAEVLGVLHPETAVPRTVRAGHAVVDAQENRIRPVADRVDRDLETSRVGAPDPHAHAGFGVLQQAVVPGRVAIGPEEIGRARPRRTVHEALAAADAHPVVALPPAPDRVGDIAPLVERQIQNDPQRHATGALHAPVACQVGPGGIHVGRGRHAEGGGMRQRASEGGVALCGGRRRDRPLQHAERLILHDALRLAGARVAQDLTTGGRGRVLRDGRGPKGSAVRQGLVAVEAAHQDGVVRGHRIDPVLARQRRALPQGVVPVAAGDPLAGLQVLRELRDAMNELLRRRGGPEVDGGQLEPTIDEVSVTVHEAGHHEPTGRREDARS